MSQSKIKPEAAAEPTSVTTSLATFLATNPTSKMIKMESNLKQDFYQLLIQEKIVMSELHEL